MTSYVPRSDVIEKLGAMCDDLGENALNGNPALHSAAEQGHIPVIHKVRRVTKQNITCISTKDWLLLELIEILCLR